MGGKESLEERISSAVDNLSPKQMRLARFILDNKYYMSFAPASQAAAKTDTSAATVVRFAQALGYGGFSEMQDALRTELPSDMTAVERMQARLGRLPAGDENPQEMFAMDIRNIQRTANSLSREKLRQAADEILRAKDIYIVGSGLSAGSVQFLAHSLRVIGYDARPVMDGGLPMAIDLAQLKPGSILIAIALWRYVRTTVKAASVAHQRGVPVIAITDSIVSPLSDKADYVFEISAESTVHSLSPTAVISFINVLIAMLSYMAPEKALESLRRVDAAYHENDLLLMK